MRAPLTDRGLARALAAVATTALLLATGLLLAVALSAPVEALHRRKVPRTVSVALIFLAGAVALAAVGYLLFPVLATQASQLAAALPGALFPVEFGFGMRG